MDKVWNRLSVKVNMIPWIRRYLDNNHIKYTECGLHFNIFATLDTHKVIFNYAKTLL